MQELYDFLSFLVGLNDFPDYDSGVEFFIKNKSIETIKKEITLNQKITNSLDKYLHRQDRYSESKTLEEFKEIPKEEKLKINNFKRSVEKISPQ